MSSTHGNPGHNDAHADHHNDDGKGKTPWVLLGSIIGGILLFCVLGWVVTHDADDTTKTSEPVAPHKVASVEDKSKAPTTPPPPVNPGKQGAAPTPATPTVPDDCNTIENDRKFGVCVLNDEDVRPDGLEDKEWSKVVRAFAPVVRAALDQFDGCREAYVIKKNDGDLNTLCQRALLCLTAPSEEGAVVCWQTGTRTNTSALVKVD